MAAHQRLGEVMHDLHAEPRSTGDLGVDRAVARVAGRQRGLITRAQLAEAGLGRGAIAHRVAEGRLHRVHRGVYLVGHRVPAPLARETAALLAIGVGAVLSHRSAAKLWQMPVPAVRDVEVSLVARRAVFPPRRSRLPSAISALERSAQTRRPCAHLTRAHAARPRGRPDATRARAGGRRGTRAPARVANRAPCRTCPRPNPARCARHFGRCSNEKRARRSRGPPQRSCCSPSCAPLPYPAQKRM